MNIEPSWEIFKKKVNKPEDIFENLVSKRLLCAKYEVLPEDLIMPPGYAGIECHPFKTKDGWVSFQAKYSHDGKREFKFQVQQVG